MSLFSSVYLKGRNEHLYVGGLCFKGRNEQLYVGGLYFKAFGRLNRTLCERTFLLKLKFTLERATKAQRGSRGIALLFL